MSVSTKYRRGRSCIHDLKLSLVFITVNRRISFAAGIRPGIEAIFRDACETMRIWLIDLSVEKDFLCCTIKYPPRRSVSEIVNCLKGVSSRRLRALYPDLKNQCAEAALWSPSYLAVSSGEPPREIIDAFIREQHD